VRAIPQQALRAKKWRIGLAGAVAASLGTGCGTPLAFRQDNALRIVSPRSLQTVTAPAHVQWVTSSPLGSGTRFAVFIDSPPLPPGRSLRSLVRRDDPCLRQAVCPDANWFELHGIRVTTATEVDIDRFPILGGVVGKTEPVIHEVIVVPIDAAGRRIGACTYSVAVRVAESAA
jgi:hypothetical protein